MQIPCAHWDKNIETIILGILPETEHEAKKCKINKNTIFNLLPLYVMESSTKLSAGASICVDL